MKTQVIQLDPHDDYISARDKIGWSKTGRVLLVFPERSFGLHRELDLVLLKRHCDSLGAQMAVVTGDEEILFSAHKLGIPIFSSITAAYRKQWRTNNRQKTKEPIERDSNITRRENIYALKALAHPATPKWMKRLEFRLLCFAIGVAAVLAITSVLMPAADITLKPITQLQEVTLLVTANAGNESVNISGAIPAHSVSVMVEGRDQIASSGSMEIPDQLASGAVVFSNLTDKPVTIPSGTIVRTTGDIPVRFATSQEIELGAGYGMTNTVEVQALKPGISGNLPEGSLTAIEGILGIHLTVENVEPTGGGATFTSPAPSSTDEKQLYDKLRAALVESAHQEVTNQLSEGDILLSSQPIKVDVINKEFDPAEALPADQLNLTLQLECDFMVAKTEDLYQLSLMSLDVNLSEGYLPVDNTLVYSMVSEPVGEQNDSYKWQINASRQIQAHIKDIDAINLILGLHLDEAISRLHQNFPLKEPPQIKLTPSWWKRIPILPFRVNVSIQ
ncbi:MAG: baseplate J/gp47 family protein [Anaerolineales bacterium]|nr:baseplate J/gp47 family protein [Anaerolineales bacterium]